MSASRLCARLLALCARLLAFVALTLVVASGCRQGDRQNPTDEKMQANDAPGVEKISLNGAGATFPFPLYSKWMSEYNKLNPGIQINYQSIGSGGGIRQVTAGTVDFGATDTPMGSEPQAKSSGGLLHIPTTLGAVAVAFNVSGVDGLKLDGETIAAIFLGDVQSWNDPRIVAQNEGSSLPDQNITVVYRSDGSGTTGVFTDYLANVWPAFREKVGVGNAVRWPTGLGAKGNEGVTGQIKVTPGAIGYTELAYAAQNKLSIMAVKNRAGQFVAPTVPAITAAAAGVTLPETLQASLANPEGETSYPISSFTYLLVHQDTPAPLKGEALARFLWWAVHDGQKFSAGLDYAPLPDAVVQKVEVCLRGLTSGGNPLLKDL